MDGLAVEGRMIRHFDQLVAEVQKVGRKKIAVAMADEEDAIRAVAHARVQGVAEPVLVGEREAILRAAEEAGVDGAGLLIEHAQGEAEAVARAVELVRTGAADVLMKGRCSTATFLKGILDKEKGLRGSGILSHLAAFEVPSYPKLILMSDAAMNVYPDLQAKVAIVQNAIAVAHRLGITKPKVALIAAVEKVNHEGMPCTADAAVIAKMAERGQIQGAFVDGPLAVDNALSAKSCEVKGIASPVGGDADILIMPTIEVGNCFYKTLTVLAGARCAGIVVGAKAPVVLSSRADSDDTKFLSIALAIKVS
ncbi:MAG: bifunctional enoyl-CoA hydratase/phosphate acetyltransferase [bacterium]|nr:bifunctional enoyl-CoA hydratase/phosphate acetyltransferase [candidate division KSB1 bacterium]MDH7558699.1 bifunctional enoyl-CoA hydratase/phosphate acetyltransferase [bacterium]